MLLDSYLSIPKYMNLLITLIIFKHSYSYYYILYYYKFLKRKLTFSNFSSVLFLLQISYSVFTAHFSCVWCCTLCSSPTVRNLLPNEDESTIQVCLGVHSWSFQSIPIHLNSILLMRVGSAGEYKCFEHVKKLYVASANKFHSC